MLSEPKIIAEIIANENIIIVDTGDKLFPFLNQQYLLEIKKAPREAVFSEHYGYLSFNLEEMLRVYVYKLGHKNRRFAIETVRNKYVVRNRITPFSNIPC